MFESPRKINFPPCVKKNSHSGRDESRNQELVFYGVVDKVKARVVAGGKQLDKSIYTLDETSSPTVSTAAVLVTMAIAAHEGRHVMTGILECQNDR